MAWGGAAVYWRNGGEWAYTLEENAEGVEGTGIERGACVDVELKFLRLEAPATKPQGQRKESPVGQLLEALPPSPSLPQQNYWGRMHMPLCCPKTTPTSISAS